MFPKSMTIEGFDPALAGAMSADHGELQLRRGARVTYLPQEPVFPDGATVRGELAVAQAALRGAVGAAGRARAGGAALAHHGARHHNACASGKPL